jgi:hypothetical protein
MSEKIYTPVEVAMQVLEKVKELAKNAACEIEKARVLDFPSGNHLGGEESKTTTPPTGKLSMAPAADALAAKKNKPKKEKKAPSSLEAFVANKKAKKTAQMEKALGMNGPAKPAGSPGALPAATPVEAKPAKPAATTAIGTPNKAV